MRNNTTHDKNLEIHVPELRTIRTAAKLTGYPEHLIRSLVENGLVRTIPAGKRQYVNMDSLLEYISGGASK